MNWWPSLSTQTPSNVHGERFHAPVADVLYGGECAATEGNRLGVVFRKFTERRVLVARNVVEDALCNLDDCKEVTLLLDVVQDLLLHLGCSDNVADSLQSVLEVESAGQGIQPLCKKGTIGRTTCVLLALQRSVLST